MKLYRTRTQEEFGWLMEKLKAEGYEWDRGISPTEGKYTLYFNKHKNQTVVWAGEDHCGPYSITYADVDYAIEEYPNKPIIEVSELMEADRLVTKIEERNHKSNAIEPEHYNKGEVDLYEAAYRTRPFNEFRAIMEFVAERYLKRDKDNRLEDLEKAIYTINRLKEYEEMEK